MNGLEYVTMKGDSNSSINAGSLPVKELLSLLSKVMEEQDLDAFLQDIARITCETFNIKAVVVGTLNEETNLFETKALWGYEPELVPKLLEDTYTYERMKYDLRDEFKIGPRAYYVRPYETGIKHEDDAKWCLDKNGADVPRSSPTKWQALDFIDFVLTDRNGKWIGWVELNDPGDANVPSPETIERIQVFTDLAGLAVENAMIHRKTLNSATYSAVKEMGNRLLEITQIVLSHKDETRLLETIADAMIDLFPISKLAIYLTDSSGASTVRVVRGFPTAQAEKMLEIRYSPVDWDEIRRVSDQIGPISLFLPGELVTIEEADGAFYDDIPKEITPRKGPNDWHPLDYIDTILFDKNGKEMGCLEILETSTKKKLPPVIISQIEMFASFASIAVEMLNVWEELRSITAKAVESRQKAEAYFDFLSHDIANLLSPMMVYAEVLRSKSNDPAEAKKLISRILEQVHHATSLILNLRRLESIEKTHPNEIDAVDLRTILSAQEDIVRNNFPDKEIVVSYDLPDVESMVVKGGDWVENALGCVYDNAVRYSTGSPVELEIRASVLRQGDKETFWQIEISDHGPGIADDSKKHLRDNMTITERDFKGVASSLPFCVSIIRCLGGELLIQDRIPGNHKQGTKIVIRLPKGE